MNEKIIKLAWPLMYLEPLEEELTFKCIGNTEHLQFVFENRLLLDGIDCKVSINYIDGFSTIYINLN